MPRQKKKHHHRRVMIPSKGRRNLILNKELDAAYNHFCGSTLSLILQHLTSLSPDCKLAKAYLLALRCEIANRRAKKNTGAMRARLYREKSSYLNELISHCQLSHYRVEKAVSNEANGPAHLLFLYLPGAQQICWHCSLGALPLPAASDAWDGQRYSTLRKLEEGLVKEFYHTCTLT